MAYTKPARGAASQYPFWDMNKFHKTPHQRDVMEDQDAARL